MSDVANAEKYKTDDGIVIDFEVTGDGAPLVMLHSGMMSREDMRDQINYFSRIYKVIAIDSRGQGRSTPLPTQISYDLMAEDVIAILNHMGINKASIFGQSDGGITALLLTYKYPDRIERAALHGAVYNHSAYPEAQKTGWKKVTFDVESEMDNDAGSFPGMAIKHYLMGRINLNEFEAHYKEMAMMWATSPTLSIDDLKRIDVPVLLIVGDHWDISISHTLEMHEALPNSELFVVPGGTHFIHHEKSDLLHNVLESFLKKD